MPAGPCAYSLSTTSFLFAFFDPSSIRDAFTALGIGADASDLVVDVYVELLYRDDVVLGLAELRQPLLVARHRRAILSALAFGCIFSSRLTLERICLGALVFALGLRIALAFLSLSELSISVLTPCRIDTLCLGAFIALRIRRPGVLSAWVEKAGLAAVIFGAAFVVVVAMYSLAPSTSRVLHQLRNSLDAFFFAALILVALKPPSNVIARIFQGRVLGFFGKYSYGLYVYHALLSWYLYEAAVDEKLDALLGNHTLAMVARVVIGVGVSILISMLSYNLFERRFLALKRYFDDTPSSGVFDGRSTASTVQVGVSSAFQSGLDKS